MVADDRGHISCQLYSSATKLAPGNCTTQIMKPNPPIPEPAPTPTHAKNVLLIIVDDLRCVLVYLLSSNASCFTNDRSPRLLRPEMNRTYGASFVSTPNLDRLGRQSTVFTRAYCQQAICGPSRNSFLSGRRPQRTQVWNFRDSFRMYDPSAQWVALPQYFKLHDYVTLGTGERYFLLFLNPLFSKHVCLPVLDTINLERHIF